MIKNYSKRLQDQMRQTKIFLNLVMSVMTHLENKLLK